MSLASLRLGLRKSSVHLNSPHVRSVKLTPEIKTLTWRLMINASSR